MAQCHNATYPLKTGLRVVFLESLLSLSVTLNVFMITRTQRENVQKPAFKFGEVSVSKQNKLKLKYNFLADYLKGPMNTDGRTSLPHVIHSYEAFKLEVMPLCGALTRNAISILIYYEC